MANQLESFTRRQFLAGAAAIVGLFLLGGCGPSELDRQVEAYKSEKTELPSLIGLDRLQRLIDTGEGMSEIVAENRISINEFIDLAAAINQENLIGLESGQLNNLMLRNANIISGLAALTINKLKTETPAGSMITDLPVKLELPGEIQDSYQEKVLAAQKLVEKINLPDMTNIPQEAWSTDFLKLFKALASHSLLQTMILERLTRADEDIVTQNDALNSARHTFLFGAIYDYLSLRPYDDGAARLDDWGAQVMDKSYWLLHKIDPESSGINPDVYDQEVLYSAYIGQLDSLANLTDETWQEQWQQFLNGLLDLRFNYLLQRYNLADSGSEAAQLLRKTLKSQHEFLREAQFVNRQILPDPINQAQISMSTEIQLRVTIGDWHEDISVPAVSGEITPIAAYLRSTSLSLQKNLKANRLCVLERDGHYHLAVSLQTPRDNTVYYLLDYNRQIFNGQKTCSYVDSQHQPHQQDNLMFELPPQDDYSDKSIEPLKIVHDLEKRGFSEKFFFKGEREILINGLTARDVLDLSFQHDVGSWGSLASVPFTSISGFYQRPDIISYDYSQVIYTQPATTFYKVRLDGKNRASQVPEDQAEVFASLGTVGEKRLIPIPADWGAKNADIGWEKILNQGRVSAANPDAFILIQPMVSDETENTYWLAVKASEVEIEDYHHDWAVRQLPEFFAYNGFSMFPGRGVMGKRYTYDNVYDPFKLEWVGEMGGWDSEMVTLKKPVSIRIYAPVSRSLFSTFAPKSLGGDYGWADDSHYANGNGPGYSTASWLMNVVLWGANVLAFNDNYRFPRGASPLATWASLTNERYPLKDLQDDPDQVKDIIFVQE